jgi:hypothetical protein
MKNGRAEYKLINRGWRFKMRTFKNTLRCLFILFLFTPGISNPQNLYFCETVDENGEPINESDHFSISSEGIYLDFLLRMENRIGVNSVCYKIYKIENGKEVYDNSIWQEVEPDWTWFWQEIVFNQEGEFNVYVYDEKGSLLASGTIGLSRI